MKRLFALIAITFIIGSYISTPAAQARDGISGSKPSNAAIINMTESNYEKDLLYKGKRVQCLPIFTEKKEEETSLAISNEEKKLLARLVHAEAKGEPYNGKVAVATVVLNRVEHKQFPNTIKEVIYEKNAFTPVQNGSINEPADREALKAVQEALKAEDGKNDKLLYFYNPETATSDWILSREVVKTIGNHVFAI